MQAVFDSTGMSSNFPPGPISPHHNCRESRAVPFYPNGDIWAGVYDGVIHSVDIDGNMQFNPLSPEATATAAQAEPAPFQRQSPPRILHRSKSNANLPFPPQASVRRPAAAAPLGRVDINVSVLADEIRKVEAENTSLLRQVKMQRRVIHGLCGIVAECGKENDRA